MGIGVQVWVVSDPEALFATPGHLLEIAETAVPNRSSPDCQERKRPRLIVAEDCDDSLLGGRETNASASLGRLLQMHEGSSSLSFGPLAGVTVCHVRH